MQSLPLDPKNQIPIFEKGAAEDVMNGFRTIVRAVEESRRAMKAGVQGFEIDAVARSIVGGVGYAEFSRTLGHQVGRFAHDGTALPGPLWEKYDQKPFQNLEQGMVFTLEPRLTVARKGVVTIEEMIDLTKDGAEYLGPRKLSSSSSDEQ
jgi:Xaa-Pro aminopeptidase